MALLAPKTLSPSKMATFRQCPRRFKLSAIDRLSEPPTLAATKGTLVHAILEQLAFAEIAGAQLSIETAAKAATAKVAHGDVAAALRLDNEALARLEREAGALAARGHAMVAANLRAVIGIELGLEATIEGARVRGIIDRLERDTNGGLCIVDYKTGRPPRAGFEHTALAGLHTYAALIEANLGVVASKIELWYLSDGTQISATPTPQTLRAQHRRTGALWSSITRSCETEHFPAKTSPLCKYCGFLELCPTGQQAVGGNVGDRSGVGKV